MFKANAEFWIHPVKQPKEDINVSNSSDGSECGNRRKWEGMDLIERIKATQWYKYERKDIQTGLCGFRSGRREVSL
jgi:hypothetical protein